jgi:hypothetical protein
MKNAWVVLWVLIAAAVGFLWMGLSARSAVLKGNKCEMTYSSRDRTEVPLCGPHCPYTLWKVTHPNSKNLNAQPVLFIPGHMGR